jgi:hypothetical protein
LDFPKLGETFFENLPGWKILVYIDRKRVERLAEGIFKPMSIELTQEEAKAIAWAEEQRAAWALGPSDTDESDGPIRNADASLVMTEN